jgi:hypothetical protein
LVALSVTVNVAVCFPSVFGVNLTAIWQLKPAGKVPTVGHVLSDVSSKNWSLLVATTVTIATPLFVEGFVRTNSWDGLLVKSLKGP